MCWVDKVVDTSLMRVVVADLPLGALVERLDVLAAVADIGMHLALPVDLSKTVPRSSSWKTQPCWLSSCLLYFPNW